MFKLLKPNQQIETKCASCGNISVYQRDKIQEPYMFHIYKCNTCKKFTGSPTDYAKCSKYGIIAKDLSSNDCKLCHQETENLWWKNCPFYLRKATYNEIIDSVRNQIDIRMLKDHNDKKGLPDFPGG